MKRTLLTLILCGLFAPVLHAAEQLATTLQQTELRSEPYSDARVISTIGARQSVRVLTRRGGWYQVRSASQSGWVRMSHIRFGDGSRTGADGSGLGETLRFLSTGRSGASGVTVATGIRGLDAADVANARPNHRAIGRLNRYAVNTTALNKFARSGKLKSQPLGYISK
jgi:uncharacterized protein YgiM (DUF1202 family)